MLGLKVLLPFFITTHGALLAAAGDIEGAQSRYDESLALGTDTGMRFYEAETSRRIAHIAARPRSDGFGAAHRARPGPVAGGAAVRAADRARPARAAGRRRRPTARAGDAAVPRRRMDRGPRGRTGPRPDAAVTAGRTARRHPRRRHGRPGSGLAAERAGLAGGASSRSPCTSAAGGSAARAQAAAGRTAGSRSTACTCGSATTRTRSGSCASATPSSTARDTDPEAPIRTWRDAFFPAATVGLEDRRADGWHHWLGAVHAERPAPGRARTAPGASFTHRRHPAARRSS